MWKKYSRLCKALNKWKLFKTTARVSFTAAMLSVHKVRLRFSQQNPSRSLRFEELPICFYLKVWRKKSAFRPVKI
jgi:hypothetical protein